jgi:hypothetical protein
MKEGKLLFVFIITFEYLEFDLSYKAKVIY